jgi:hypothetical protein
MRRTRLVFTAAPLVLVVAAGLQATPSFAATASGTWSGAGSLTTARFLDSATLLPNGQVLVSGGVNFVKHSFTQLASSELYTP